MTGWAISRHPEWDMMYAAGLTVREIAMRCHQHDNTVRLHLKVRELYWPGLRATHETALAGRGSDIPTTVWRRRQADANQFLADHGRLPRVSIRSERNLAAWVSSQRIAFGEGKLSTPKIVLMGEIIGWNVSPRQRQLDQHWHDRLAELTEFVAANGAMPRYRNHRTEHEHVLGVWLHTQHQGRAEGTLPRWRLEAINSAHPGWKSGT